jgi:transposase
MSIDVATASREELATAYLVLAKQLEEEKAQNAWLVRQLFGRKTERLIPQDPKQSTLFDVPELPPAQSVSIQGYERNARRNPTDTGRENGIRFDPSVPVDEEVVYPEKVRGLPAEAFEVIGEKVTERLVQIPTQYRVKRTRRVTVKLNGELLTAPAPDAVIERSFADVTFLAGMITDKFQYHLPLYRQHQRLSGGGVHVSRGHLTTLTHRTLELLEPVYYSILSSITTSDFVSMDETPIKAGRREKGKMQTAYFWPVFAEEQVAFVYSSSRGHGVVSDILGKGCKKLLSDGYSAYERYAEAQQGFTHAQCWAHVRRKFFEARQHAPPECDIVLNLIRELFEIEQSLLDGEPERVLSVRREESLPRIDQLFSYLNTLWFEKMVDPVSLLGNAVAYTRKREHELRQFLLHPEIPISNNHVERAIRPVALGRKNWLFCWSEVGAKYAAIAFTLIECCKLHKVDPWTYLVDVLQRLDSHPAREVHLLTPKLWAQHRSEKSNNAA